MRSASTRKILGLTLSRIAAIHHEDKSVSRKLTGDAFNVVRIMHIYEPELVDRFALRIHQKDHTAQHSAELQQYIRNNRAFPKTFTGDALILCARRFYRLTVTIKTAFCKRSMICHFLVGNTGFEPVTSSV